MAAPFLVTAAFLFAILLLLPVRYESNDDFAIIRQLNPLNGFRTDAQVHLMGRIPAQLLYWLYQAQPQVPWYGLLLYLGVWLGSGLAVGAAWRSAPGRAAFYWAPAWAIFFGFCASFLSFTAVSLMLLFGALLALLEWSSAGRCPVKAPRIHGALLLIALLLALLLRWQLVAAMLPFGLPVALFAGRAGLRRAVLPALAILAVFGVDRMLYRSPGDEAQRAYERYNRLRTRFHDTVEGAFREGSTESALAETGWTRADYQTFRSWVLYDDVLFNAERLETFLGANRLEREEAPRTLAQRAAEQALRNWLLLTIAVLSLAAVVLRGMSIHGRLLPRAVLLRMLAGLGVVGGGVLVLIVYRLVPRVLLPLLVYWIGTAVVLFGRVPAGHGLQATSARLKTAAAGVAFLALALAGLEASQIVRVLGESARDKAPARDGLRALRDRVQDPELTIMIMDAARGLRFESIHPLKEFAEIGAVRILPGGTSVNSPRFRRILDDLGLQSGRELLEWMIDNPHALLVLNSQGERQDFFWKYLWLSYYQRNLAAGREIGLLPVHDFSGSNHDGLIFYRVVTGAAGGEGPAKAPSS
ncbi:MAG: hypothetical protein V1774_09110 [Candidatus Eisenbacteria bacterium]